MKVFDLKKMKAFPYEEREKNVFFNAKEFRTRIIELPPHGKIPNCEMSSYVIFNVITGNVEVTVNSEKRELKEGQCLITEPASLSMYTENGVKIMGIQIEKIIE